MQKTRTGNIIKFDVDQKKVDRLIELKNSGDKEFPRFGVLVLSYNASEHIEKTIARIPSSLKDVIEEIFIFDDNSPDNTYDIANGLRETSVWKEKLSVYKNPRNLRYGGNQKVGYNYAIEKNLDFVIMLHGDGQYAPEYIPDLMLPAVEDGEKVVFASRMINKKDALKGGMPFYKFIGNQVLTRFENLILGTKLAEFHSGYRMYGTEVLKRLPIEENTHEFHFDTEIIIQCRHLGVTIKEIPIKTFYGDEECNVDGFRYAWDVVKAVVGYRLHQLHIIRKGSYVVEREAVYTRKLGQYSSHEMILKQINSKGKVLYLGASDRLIYNSLLEKSNDVVCVENNDLSKYENINFSREFDYIILSDVLAQIADGRNFLKHIKKFLKPEGEIIVSVPNIVSLPYRLSIIFGRFNYSEKGTFDRRHLRFFTHFSSKLLLERSGFDISSIKATSMPFEVVLESSGKSQMVKWLESTYYIFAKNWKRLFAYQFILTAKINHLDNASGEGKLL